LIRALALCSGPGVDDLFRVFLLPAASPPVELFINVPDAELLEYPHVPSVQALCGTHSIAVGDLLLFGEALEFVEDCARDRNTHLAPLLTKLEPVGSYLLVHRDGNLPESITVSNVLSALTFTAEWEDSIIEGMGFRVEKYDDDGAEIEAFTAPSAQIAPASPFDHALLKMARQEEERAAIRFVFFILTQLEVEMAAQLGGIGRRAVQRSKVRRRLATYLRKLNIGLAKQQSTTYAQIDLTLNTLRTAFDIASTK